MTASTHASFAELLYLSLLTTAGVSLTIPNAAVTAAASLLPDIDTGASRVGKLFPRLTLSIERRFGHRTLTHSLLALAILGVLLIPLLLLNSDLYACFLAGYASHILLDTATVHGARLFYPFAGVKCVFPFEVNNPHRYRAETGSRADHALGILFLIGCLPAFYVASQGYERFIRVTQQSIEAAVRDYNEYSKGSLVMARVDAFDVLTRERLTGEFEVVGALNEHTLIFKGADNGLHTLGKEFQADYVAEEVVCSRSEEASASVRTIDMSNRLLGELASCVDTVSENYFFGDLMVLDKVSLPENVRMFMPITGTGGVIRFNYARLNDIAALNLEYAFVTKGILTIKSVRLYQQRDSVSGVGYLPWKNNSVQLHFAVDAAESLIVLKQKGDTVEEGDFLARKYRSMLHDEQIAVNEERTAAVESQYAAALEDLQGKIAVASGLASGDSAEYAETLLLVEKGYAAPAKSEPLKLKWEKEAMELNKLIGSETVVRHKMQTELAKLRLFGSQLQAKVAADARKSEVRSTVRGRVVEVREMALEGKRRVMFIIKR